ncbi:MAG: ATP phosphoribosyltransferase [Euryarchaeota archaeon]|nr:ATP phosphoribosyltransferase [Euryarchaeota archaeon]
MTETPNLETPTAARSRTAATPDRAAPLKIAVPNKGRLSEQCLDLFTRAGIRLDYSHERKLFAEAREGRIKVLFLRAQDIPEFVADGVAHLGVTGHDIIAESGRPLDELIDLGFGSCRLVLAVPEESPIRTVEDLPKRVTCATSFPALTKAWFEARKVEARVIPVSGATEITPHLGIADVITDLTSTGSTLVMNGLREVDTLLRSSARLVATPGLGDGSMGREIEEFVFALRSVIAARGKRYLLADVPRTVLDEIRAFLPGIAGPTVVDVIGDEDMVAIHVVVDEAIIYDAVARLKRIGARGILVMPIDRMVA